MPKISIIVPCYNVEKYLHQCLDSLTGQTCRDIEIITVDDGSPDNSGAICDAYAAKDSRVRVIHKKNGGVSAARNDGLEAAAGEYVLFCDGDDWMPLDACEHFAAGVEEYGADVIFGDIWRSWEGRDEYMRFFAAPFCTGDTTFIRDLVKTNFYYTYCPSVPGQNRADGCYGGPWNKIVKRSLLLEQGIRFDTRLKGIYDDVLYTSHVLANAKSVAYIGKPIYNYRQINQSISRAFKKNILEINEAIFTCWAEFLSKHDPNGEWTLAYNANVVRRLEHALELYFLSDANPAPEKQRKQELATLLKQEPYRSAVRNVEMKKLTKRNMLEAWMAAHNCIEGLWLVYGIHKQRKMKRRK